MFHFLAINFAIKACPFAVITNELNSAMIFFHLSFYMLVAILIISVLVIAFPIIASLTSSNVSLMSLVMNSILV